MSGPTDLMFDRMRAANVSRSVTSYHHAGAGLADWSPTDWATAFGGEAGEALNQVKKLRRLTSINPGHDELQLHGEQIDRVLDELADAVLYADLLAARLDRSLGEAIRRKFNAKSIEIGAPERL